MTDARSLRRLFNRVILASLAPPALLGACGGQTATGGSDAAMKGSDAGKHDAAMTGHDAGMMGRDAHVVPKPDARGTDGSPEQADCGTFACGGCSCGPGCLITTVCINGMASMACNCDAGIDAGLSCTPDRTQNFYLPLDCIDGGVPADAGAFMNPECGVLCGTTKVQACGLVEASGGSMVLGCYLFLGGGRRPAGFVPTHAKAKRDRELGAYLASAAELEAASVPAFRTLAGELRAHGAPSRLVAQANKAARDEVRHARVVGALARKHGAGVTSPASPAPRRNARAPKVRPLLEVAIENAVEGCVRETFGALTATVQAMKARDPKVRAAMERIAVDETRHAALGWAVSAWVDSRLDDEGRARVRDAREAAVRDLLAEVAHDPPETLRAQAGLPSAREGAAMLREMTARFWAPAA